MSIFIKVLFLLIIFLNTSLYAKTLRIAVSNDLAPYSYLNKNNKLEGILIDYWRLWSKRTGIDITFVPSSWSQTLSAIKNKEVDIHSGLFFTKQRNKDMVYLDKVYSSISTIYIRNKENINSIKDLDNKTLAFLKDTYYASFFKEKYPNIKLKTFNTYEDLHTAFNNKEVDSFIDDSLIIWMNIIRYFSYNKIKTLDDFIIQEDFYAAVIKEDQELKNIVQKGLKLITNKDMIALEKKWIINKDLRLYSKKTSQKNLLSKSQKEFLQNNPNLKIATIDNWKNFSYKNQNNELEGFHVDLLKKINKILDTNIKFKVYSSWSKSFEDTKNAKVAGIFGLSWSKKRDTYFNYSPPYHYSPFHLITRDDDDSIKSLDDIENKIAITIKNNISNTIIKNKNKNVKFLVVEESIDRLKKTKTKEGDFFLIETLNKELLKQYNLKVSKIIYSKEGTFSLVTAKKNIVLSEIFNIAISSLGKDFLRTLEKKWVTQNIKESIFTKEEQNYIKNAPELIIGVDDWKPVVFSDNRNSIGGITGDILERIKKISSLKFKIKKGQWNQLQEDFRNKQIDILPSTVLTKQRLKHGLFTQSYLNNKTKIYVKLSNTSIKSFKDLNYKKLAIQEASSTITRIKERYPNIIIVQTKGLKESYKLLESNKVDALYAFELNINYMLDELFINSLKIIYQREIIDEKIRIFSQKDNILLNSILEKSLYSISYQERNEIISKWSSIKKRKDKLNIILKSEKEPYVINKKYLKGIEYDLIDLIFSKSNISINSAIISKNIDNFSIKDLDLDLDLKENDNSTNKINLESYYSDSLIDFKNIIVSKKVDNFSIKKIKDLKNKRILAFNNSYKIFGNTYYDLFNPLHRPNIYLEEDTYEKIIQSFLNNDVEIIILPINIFKWHLKQHSIYNIKDFDISYILPKTKSINFEFKNKQLRNLFNKNLSQIKKTGEYVNIFNKYIKTNISSKIEILNLLSSLLGKFIFEEDKKELKNILNIFSKLDYINKIEVYSNKLLYSSSNKKYDTFIKHDVNHNILNINSKVGHIKVSFNNKKLLNATHNLKLIPKLFLFDNLKSYSYIKSKYKDFKYLEKKIAFTKREKEFIAKHPIIKFSEINWKPLSIIENNKFTGLISDYLNIIEEKSTLHFKYVKAQSWSEVLNKLKNNEIDLIPGIDDNNEYKKIGLVSSQYTTFSFAIVRNSKGSFISDLSELENKTVAIPKFYTSYNLIKNKYPKIKIIPTKTINEALKLVSLNKAFAFVGHEAIAVYNIQNDFKDLKIVGVSKLKFKHHLLVKKDYPELISIINKVFNSITYQEKNKIRDRWLKVKINTAVDYTIIYYMVFIFLIILIIILYFMQKLNHAKKEIEIEKKKFKTLFSDTADPVILAKDGKYMDVNNSLLKLFEYKSKKEFIEMSPGTLAPKYQKNNVLSTLQMEIHLNNCYKNGTERFNWQSKKLSGTIFWVEIVLTKLKYSNEDIIHMLCRDISESKALELKIQEQKDLFEALFTGTSDGLLLLEDDKIINTNYSLLQMYNIKDVKFFKTFKIGSLAPKIQPNGDNSQEIYQKYLTLCKKNNYATFERLALKITGEEFWVNIILIQIKTNNRNLIYSISRDISNRKFLENEIQKKAKDLEYSNEELENSNEELQTTISNLNQTQAKLIDAEKMAALGGLVAGVAHEINTPVGIGLTGISHLEDSTKEILLKYKNEDMSQEEFEEYLKTTNDLSSLVHKNLEKAASLVRSFKQVAVDQSSEEKRFFNIKDYISEVLQSIYSVTKKNKS